MTKKLVLGAAVAALAAAGSLGGNTGFAQTPPPAQPPQQQPSATPEGAPTATPSVTPGQTGAQPQMQKDQQSASDWRSSKIVGMTVYNGAGENIGEVDDLILGSDGRVQNAVLGVGGFLGMGEKLVAVPFSDLKLSRDDRGSIRLVLNSSRDTLQAAPEFRYHGDASR